VVVRREVLVAYLVAFPSDEGEIIVELNDEQLAGFTPAAVSPGEVAARASDSFEKALDKLLPATRAVSTKLQQLQPDELTVELGVKLTAEAGVILSKAAGEANFTITLKWGSTAQ
jgi:hypothetical protein